MDPTPASSLIVRDDSQNAHDDHHPQPSSPTMSSQPNSDLDSLNPLGTLVNSLPPEMLEYLIDQMSLHDQLSIRLVSRHFNTAQQNLIHKKTHLTVWLTSPDLSPLQRRLLEMWTTIVQGQKLPRYQEHFHEEATIDSKPQIVPTYGIFRIFPRQSKLTLSVVNFSSGYPLYYLPHHLELLLPVLPMLSTLKLVFLSSRTEGPREILHVVNQVLSQCPNGIKHLTLFCRAQQFIPVHFNGFDSKGNFEEIKSHFTFYHQLEELYLAGLTGTSVEFLLTHCTSNVRRLGFCYEQLEMGKKMLNFVPADVASQLTHLTLHTFKSIRAKKAELDPDLVNYVKEHFPAVVELNNVPI